MGSLGEDLLLVAIDPSNGVLRCRGDIQYGLMGAELVELAAAGLVELAADRISVVQPVPVTADSALAAAVSSLAAARRPPRVRAWVGKPRRGIANSYLTRLIDAGTVRRQGGVLRPRWPVTDAARAATVRARLDTLVLGTDQADAGELTFAALADAIGLVALLYRGRDHRQARKRLRDITKGHWAAEPVRRAVAAAEAAATGG
jgi:Golgi phosphoprotein 3 (GPP34)